MITEKKIQEKIINNDYLPLLVVEYEDEGEDKVLELPLPMASGNKYRDMVIAGASLKDLSDHMKVSFPMVQVIADTFYVKTDKDEYVNVPPSQHPDRQEAVISIKVDLTTGGFVDFKVMPYERKEDTSIDFKKPHDMKDLQEMYASLTDALVEGYNYK